MIPEYMREEMEKIAARNLEELNRSLFSPLVTRLLAESNASLIAECKSVADEQRKTRRAQLAPSPRHDRASALRHDFRNAVESLVFAVELADREAIARISAALIEMYGAKLKRPAAAE